jgi:two-component system cell cycle sensor histidine kinase/response regulator CckA
MQALREKEDRYAAIFAELSVGLMVFEVTEERRIVDANPAAARMLGYEPDELIGLTALDITFAEDLEREQPLYEELLAGTRDRFTIEKRYRRKDGQVIWGRAGVSAVRLPDGEAQFVLKLVDDVTPERNAQEERRALEEQLRQAQKMEALGRLSGGIAHDFNNLLQVIGGHAQLALAAEPEAVHEHASEVLAATARASALTEQLLAFSRMQPLKATPTDLNDVIRMTESMLRRLLGPDVQLYTDLAPEPCVVSVDRTRMEQIVLNLAVNARDAMPNGGPLTIETREVQRDGEPWVVLIVVDRGEGMDAETLERAFDPFFTTKEVGKGTGLGLSTVDGIVHQCGGEITVRSAPGEGTRFKLAFPEVPDSPDAPVPARARFDMRGDETLLLVDDDDAVRGLAAKYLATQGYHVVSAASGAEAVAIFEREPVDLLVTDAVMPEMSGRELYRRLEAERPGLPVVYMSGFDPSTARVPEDEEHSVFLQKPYSLVKLGEAVRSLLSR